MSGRPSALAQLRAVCAKELGDFEPVRRDDGFSFGDLRDLLHLLDSRQADLTFAPKNRRDTFLLNGTAAALASGATPGQAIALAVEAWALLEPEMSK